MRISLGELRKSLQGKRYLISSFSYKNLVIFCDGCLTFVYGFVNNNGLAEYSRSVKVILSPRIPDHVEISSMSAILDGSLVVLSSADSLFIVRVSADLIYHAENICDVPRMTIDYVSFMCASDRTCEGYGSNSYGFFKSIVSFDCIVLSDECPTVIAIDTEGEMYSTVINISSNSPPLTRPLIPPTNLPCDPIDIRIIDHPANDVFSVFAILSASSSVSFVIAVPDESYNYSLFLEEHLQLSPSSYWRLCASDFESTILVANESVVLHLDLSPWIEDFCATMTESGKGTGASRSRRETIARELMSMSAENEKGAARHNRAQDRAVGLICKATNPRECTTMFIASSQNPPLATAFLKQKIVLQSTERDLAQVSAEQRSIVSEKALNAILARKETLRPIGPASSRQQLFKNLTEFFVSAQKNQVVLCAALEMSKDRIEVLMKLATQLSEKQNALNQRLLQVFRQNAAIKDRNELLRADVTKTLSRVDKVSSRLWDHQKLSADELKLLGKLKEYRAK
ncbi:unnamed protein product, partial [Nippostrongylus brasiliensis]|uniref:RING-type domain-containing protein n=1 Tax=Nippostrongylus brasiliensis TaxID=27835 RepID=A0A0N4XGG3_NIPBR